MSTATHSSVPFSQGDPAAPLLRNRLAPLAQPGSLQELLRLMGTPAQRHGPLRDAPVPLWLVHEEAVLLHEGERGQTLYIVRSGSLKCVRTLEDGYEQVLSFVQPGELLGFEAFHGGVQPSSVVALEDATVYALSAQSLPELQRQCPVLHEALWRGLSRQLARAAETAEMMAAVASDVRLARFILWMSRRMADAGQSPRRLHLRMARRDIASLLGVAHETVSRSFTLLADRGCIRVDNRDVEIIDRAALQARARSTRGLSGEPAHQAPRPLPPEPPQTPPLVRGSTAQGRWWASVESMQPD